MSLLTEPRLLMAAVGATALGQTLLFAILPSLARSIGLQEIQVGLIITCSALVYALAIPVWGRFSEMAGRKRVILTGLIGYAAGTLIFALVFEMALAGWLAGLALMVALVGVRCLQALIMAASPPAATAYMADITEAAQRVKGMGKIGAAHNIGTILGPGIGGALTIYGLTTPLYWVSITVVLVVIVVWKKLPESPWAAQAETTSRPFSIRQALGQSLRTYVDRRLVDLLSIGILMFIGFAMVQQTLGFLFQDRFGLSPLEAAGQVGFILMLSAVASLSGQIILVQRLGISGERLLLLMLPLLAAGFALVFWGPTSFWIGLAIVFIGLGLGLGMPGVSGSASLRVGAGEQGAVAGMISASPALGFIIGPLLGTGLYQWNPDYCYGLVMFLLLPLAALILRMNFKRP